MILGVHPLSTNLKLNKNLAASISLRLKANYTHKGIKIELTTICIISDIVIFPKIKLTRFVVFALKV